MLAPPKPLFAWYFDRDQSPPDGVPAVWSSPVLLLVLTAAGEIGTVSNLADGWEHSPDSEANNFIGITETAEAAPWIIESAKRGVKR